MLHSWPFFRVGRVDPLICLRRWPRMKTSGVINNAFVQYQVQRVVYCECRRVNVTIATSLLSFVCDALELCLLHSSLPSLLCTPPSLPAKLPSVSTTLYFLFLQQWQQQCRQPDCPPHTHTHPPTLLPTRLPKGRKARLWPSAWWARTAVCSGITPAEKGGIPSPGTFVRRGRCLVLTRQLFKALLAPTDEVKGRNSTSD